MHRLFRVWLLLPSLLVVALAYRFLGEAVPVETLSEYLPHLVLQLVAGLLLFGPIFGAVTKSNDNNEDRPEKPDAYVFMFFYLLLYYLFFPFIGPLIDALGVSISEDVAFYVFLIGRVVFYVTWVSFSIFSAILFCRAEQKALGQNEKFGTDVFSTSLMFLIIFVGIFFLSKRFDRLEKLREA